MSVVLSLADFDLPTRSSSGFLLRWIVPRMVLEPATLYAVLARRLPFQLSAPRSDIIIGTGHGERDAFTGQNEAVIWRVGDYDPKEVRGKVIKLLSCYTGASLGIDIVAKGANCFMGYKDEYVWVMDADKASTPWSDKMAAACLGPVVASINALLDGKTAGEAFQVELDLYTRNAEAEDNELIKSCIEFNRDNSVIIGDRGAKVKARPRITLPLPPPPLPPSFLSLF